jgi:hypothetical protein
MDYNKIFVLWIMNVLWNTIISFFISFFHFQWGERGSVVVKELCYKPDGRGFETQRGE